MATIKSFTSLEQSKKLAEILPLESADMSWVSNGLGKPFARTIPIKGDPEELCGCWSLAALLEVLPNKLQIALVINDFQGDRKEKYAIGSVEHDRYDCYADNPVDACVEMIIKLKEKGLL